MDEAERCDRLVFMRDGQVIANDTLANILLQTSSTSAENAFLALAKKQEVAA
jgi:ABC-2 type transport system ATP-binding protein